MIRAIGKRIREIRSSKGIEAKLMASKLKMKLSGYSKIERGETNIPTRRLLQIADILGVSVRDFFEDATTPSLKDTKTNYGFATREELENLSKVVLALTKEIEKLRSELSKNPPRKRKIKH